MTTPFEQLFRERIVIIDGAMGSLIQTYSLEEKDFRGQRFLSHPKDLKGNNDLLCLTRPDIIEEIHARYFASGADVVETNTFSSTSIAQADYDLGHVITDLNLAAAQCARRAANAAQDKTPGRKCFVAGAIGPLNRTLSMSPDVNRPDFRAVTWNQVVCAYEEQVRALLQGGVDALLVETIFDTLNSKAALFAIEGVFEELGRRVPVMISVTITDASGRTCFVAGAIGPLNRTLSMSPDVNRPDYRAVTWNQVVAAYEEQVRALLQGGVDALLVETIFDTLNAKAALFAIEGVFEELGRRVPVMISVTITDASGRTLSGQTITAFYDSVRHSKPFSVGINCALGGAEMRPYIQELARVAECYVSCYPNAGLPNAFGGYDETPDEMAAVLTEFAQQGWLNLVGGCCGSTPEHIAAIAKGVKPQVPHQRPAVGHDLRLSGLESLVVAAAARSV